MPTRLSRALVVALFFLATADRAHADKIDDLTRTLLQDPSYKVRVQAALVLGKLNDRRAVPALTQALHDENETVRGVAATSLGKLGDKSAAGALMQSSTEDASEFVRGQARHALEMVANGGGGGATPLPAARAGARFYVAIEFNGGKGGAEYAKLVREALLKELQKLPTVTLSVGSGGTPSRQLLASKHLSGFVLDGTIQRLAASPAGGGSQQIDCDLKAFVATFPERAIKMTTTEGASLQTGLGVGMAESGKRDCLAAAAEALRDDVNKFLGTQQ